MEGFILCDDLYRYNMRVEKELGRYIVGREVLFFMNIYFILLEGMCLYFDFVMFLLCMVF